MATSAGALHGAARPGGPGGSCWTRPIPPGAKSSSWTAVTPASAWAPRRASEIPSRHQRRPDADRCGPTVARLRPVRAVSGQPSHEGATLRRGCDPRGTAPSSVWAPIPSTRCRPARRKRKTSQTKALGPPGRRRTESVAPLALVGLAVPAAARPPAGAPHGKARTGASNTPPASLPPTRVPSNRGAACGANKQCPRHQRRLLKTAAQFGICERRFSHPLPHV